MTRLVTAVALAVAMTFVAGADSSDGDTELQFQAATHLFDEARYAEAFAAYENAMRSSDPALAIRARKGHVRSALRIAEFTTARREAAALKEEAPSDPEALTIYADALWAAGLFDEAEAEYRAALTINPQSARARLGVGRALATQSRLEEALTQVLASQAADPSDYQAHATLGDVYTRLNRFDDAADAFTRYQSLLAPSEAASAAVSRAQISFLRSFKGRAPLAMSDEVATGVHTVPFRLSKNKVLIKATLNERYTTELVLDTGAERIGLTADAARRARLQPVSMTMIAGVGGQGFRPLALTRVDSLRIGSLRVSNVPVSVRNPVPGTMARWQSETFSPIALGLSVEVDYKRRKVTFAKALPEGEADIRLPIRLQRLPMVRGLLNSSHAAPFVVDTGGELISISTETAQALAMKPSRRIPLRVYGLSGWDEDAFLLPGVDVHFGDIQYNKLGLAVLNLRAPSVLLGFELGGIVGYKFLGEYRAAIDLARSELRLARN